MDLDAVHHCPPSSDLVSAFFFFFAVPFHLQPKSFTVNDYSTTGGWLGLVAEFRPHVLGNGGFEVHQVLEAFFFVSLDV